MYNITHSNWCCFFYKKCVMPELFELNWCVKQKIYIMTHQVHHSIEKLSNDDYS